MRIADSTFSLGAGRNYLQQTAGISRKETGLDFRQFAGTAVKDTNDTADADTARNTAPTYTPTYNRSALLDGTAETGDVKDHTMTYGVNGMRDTLLLEILERLLSSGMQGFTNSAIPGAGSGLGIFSGVSAGQGAMTMTTVRAYEREDVSFFAQGGAMTEDGRMIDFNINLFLSRSFVDLTRVSIPLLSNALCDPLIVNVDSACTELSDQTFRFDLNLDGEENEISMLKKGNGFLALDKNGDGIINDGSELFGAKSGDGFAELAEYDTDGNGWIDENDEIFDRLRIWYKQDDGTDELVDLKAAGIGAINLGSVSTDFSLYGGAMQMNGMIRSTGFFLREDGTAGTVQHVDLALRENEAYLGGSEASDVNRGIIRDISFGENGNALVIETSPETLSASEQTESLDDQSSRAQQKKESRAEENAAKKEQQKRRVDEAARRKAQTERYYERRRLNRKQLEELFADRAEERKQLTKDAYEEQLEENNREQELLEEEIAHSEELDAMLSEQIAAVA